MLLCCVQTIAQSPGGEAVTQAYVGQYRGLSNPDFVTSVYLEGGRLYEESEQTPRQELTPDGPAGRFRMGLAAQHFVFVRDDAGAVTGLKMVLDRGGKVAIEEERFSSEGVRLNYFRQYTRQQVTIPMRDGVKLHAVILRPAGSESGEALPFLLERTPYGVDDETSVTTNRERPELAASGYIFVHEDIRGRYKSEGEFVMNRPVVSHTASDTHASIDETTDTRDTIDWLLKKVPNNSGKVGVYGISYPGFLAMMAGIDPHPAVKAISPQAPMTDVWLGDDFFHNGAFRQAYGFDYVQQMEAQKVDAMVESKEDTYDFFLREGNFANAASAAGMADLPTAKAFLSQPTYTKFWQDMAVQPHLTQASVPTLEVGGYWDQEDMWGTQAEYAALKAHDPQHQVFLVLGPWNHDGWESPARRLGSNFGALDFGEATGTTYRKTIEAPFFEKYLKGRPGFDLVDTASFRTGPNVWERYDAWPPVSVPTAGEPQAGPGKSMAFLRQSLYLMPGKKLDFTTPRGADNAVAAMYGANPADPVPYRHRPIQSTYGHDSKWYTWLVEDQRFVTGRKDVASFTTPVLDHDVTVTGEVMADLYASTTGSDADWVVKLIDVYPDDAPVPDAGYQLMVADEIFRGRYLKSFEQPEALKPGEVNEFRYSLHGADHTFFAGHRIMVEVQSSWFPLYDRNPQTFVPNIMSAPAEAYKAATMTIYGSAKYPSHLEFSVAP